MTMFQAGDHNTTETVHIPFNTFTSDDPSASVTITNLVAGDIEIHKDGSTDKRSSDNGVTVSINFDGVTGNHMVHIDLSDNSHDGYYADDSRYQVRLEGITVDGATLNVWIGCFSIGCTLRPTTAGRTLDVNATGEAGLDLDNTSGTIDAAQLGADCITAAKIADDAISSEHLNTGALTADVFAANALVAATFAATSLDDKGDWNTTTPPTAAAIVNEWETQSQADPTGFHVNVKEVNGTAQTANDNGADINALIAQIGTAGDGLTDLGGMSATMKTQVESEVVDGLATYDASTQTNIITVIAHILDVKGTGFAKDTHSLPQCLTATGFSTHDAAAVKTAIEAGGSHLALIKAVTDVRLYHADIQLTVDETNSKDEYTVVWFKNGVRVTSGITVPKVQVVKRVDGTDLVAQTAMSQIGATGAYKYDEASNRITAGEAVFAVVTATIDGSGRSFPKVLTRDSSA